VARTEFAMLRLALSLEENRGRLSKLRMLIIALERKEAEHSKRIFKEIRKALIEISRRDGTSDEDLAMVARLRLRLDGCDKDKLQVREAKDRRIAELRARMKMSGSDPALVAPKPPASKPTVDIFDIGASAEEVK